MSSPDCTRTRASGPWRLAMPLGAAACAAALALRLPHLGSESLWYDETVSAYLAAQPLRELLLHTSLDIHPPGYYVLLRGWSLAAGSGEYCLAYLSAWFGVLLVALTYQLTRRLFGPGAGLVAAALSALSAYSIWYSQEVRMYTLGACLCTALLLATLSHLRRPRLASALVWGFTAAAALYVLYYALFLALAMSFLLLAVALLPGDRRRHLRLWALAQATAVVAYLPWLGIAVRQATDPPVPPWRSRLTLAQMLRDGALALLGGEALPTSLWPLAALALVLAAGGAWLKRRREGGIALASFVVPWLGLVAASLVTPLFHPRYLFPFVPGFWACLAAAVNLASPRNRTKPGKLLGPAASSPGHRSWAVRAGRVVRGVRSRGLAAIALGAYIALNAVALHHFWHDPAYRPDDLRGAVQALAAEWCPGDVILANAGYTYTAIAYYWPGPPVTYARLTDNLATGSNAPLVLKSGSIGGNASLGWGNSSADFYSTTAEQSTAALQRVLDGGSRLWQLRLYDTVTDPQGDIRHWLETHAVLTEDRQVPGPSFARLQAYVPPATVLPCAEPADWDGAASLCATVGDEQLGYVPVRLSIRFGATSTTPHFTLRLVGPTGQVVAQRDGVLGGGVFAATAPSKGLLVAQPVSLRVGGDLPEGCYQVQLGLYTLTEDNLQLLRPSPSSDSDLAAQGLLLIGYVDVRRP